MLRQAQHEDAAFVAFPKINLVLCLSMDETAAPAAGNRDARVAYSDE